MPASAGRAHRRAAPPDKPSPKQAVLGLVIEIGRDITALELARELNKRLETADFSRNYVYWVLGDLAEKGQIAEGPPVTRTDRLGRVKGTRTWHTTELGVARFRAWLRSPIADPGLRDELLIRIEFCPEAEISVLEEHIKALERHAMDEIYRLKSDSAERLGVEGDQSRVEIWSRKRREIRYNAELAFWESRLKSLQATLLELTSHAPEARPVE